MPYPLDHKAKTNVYRGLFKGLEPLHTSEPCEPVTYLAV